jgi:hypothetical protein
MLGRRFLLIVAVLMGLTAVAASFAPRDAVERDRRSESTPSPAPSGGSTVTTVQKELAIEDGESKISVDQGDLVELTVSGPERESVMLLDRIEAIDPVSPARFSILADRPGQHPIELVESGRRVGTLVIRESG